MIRKIDRKIPVKAIGLYMYESFKESLNLDFKNRRGMLFVGGFAHRPNADAVLWFVKEIYPAVRTQLGDVPFYVVGQVPDEIQGAGRRRRGDQRVCQRGRTGSAVCGLPA